MIPKISIRRFFLALGLPGILPKTHIVYHYFLAYRGVKHLAPTDYCTGVQLLKPDGFVTSYLRYLKSCLGPDGFKRNGQNLISRFRALVDVRSTHRRCKSSHTTGAAVAITGAR